MPNHAAQTLDLTCAYGLNPFRPLLILMMLTGAFFVPYWIAILTSGGLLVRSGVFVIRPSGTERPEPILGRRLDGKSAGLGRHLFILGAAFYFSVHSAFQIGWRDFNIGNWLSRLQPVEFGMVGRGWVRSISGVQSLISVYLLALTIFSYFGRPFAW
ncbi:MAG: hypothetical protein GY813_11135 [Halieaceae bacterium]|nr:hypothetical protein [Halieaceae bacterium]